MTDGSPDDGISYTRLLTDPSVLAVIAISFTGAFAANAIPTTLPAIGDAFAVGDGRIGLVMTAFFLPVIVMNPVVGVLVDIYGRRRVVLPALFVFGTAGVAAMFAVTFPQLLVLRALQGMAFAGTLPLTSTLMGDLYTGSEGATVQGLRSSANGLSNALAPVVAGVLATLSWRYPFLVFAMAFPALAIVYVAYPEPIEPAVDGGAHAGIRAELGGYWASIKSEANDRNLLLLLCGGFALFFVKQGMKAYVPVYLVSAMGGDVATAGLVFGVYGAVRVPFAPLSGPVTERIGRKYTLVLAAATIAVGVSIIPAATGLPLLLVAVSVFAVGEAVFNPVVSSGVADLTRDDTRGGIMSGLASLKSTANALSPAVVGLLVALSGFTVAFVATAVVAVVYGVCVLLLVDPRAV